MFACPQRFHGPFGMQVDGQRVIDQIRSGVRDHLMIGLQNSLYPMLFGIGFGAASISGGDGGQATLRGHFDRVDHRLVRDPGRAQKSNANLRHTVCSMSCCRKESDCPRQRSGLSRR